MQVRLGPRCTGAESAGGKSAVDDHTVAGHKRRLIRTHPENGFGHFLDPTDAPDGMKSGKIILFHIHAIGEPIDHLGAITAGLTALMRMPCAEYSNAATFVSPMTACLDAA